MTEIVFLVQSEPEGGYSAQALGASVLTQAEDMPTLREVVRDASRCPDASARPKIIRVHFVSDEVVAA